jgi:hypothetical protein
MSKLSEEWLKIKIVRDFNIINKPQKTGFFNVNVYQKNKLFGYSPNYLNLLELIKNTWLIQQIQQFQIATKKLHISDLDKMDIDFLEEISKLDNIEIVNSPYFQYMYIENNSVFTKSCFVDDIMTDTIKYIKEHSNNYTFHIYQINPDYARWYRREDKNRLKRNRRKKLEKLKLEC